MGVNHKMYRVDRETKTTSEIQKITFADAGFRERPDLQEWIVNNPSILGEELLIIQKEFAGFDGTNERLDLLALDKDMNLVIIENKLDDSGRDVVWQASKYASYCSNLTVQEIKSIYQDYLDKYQIGGQAEHYISEFYEGVELEDLQLNRKQTERIILVAANFRREVTSTVQWMRTYGINISCIKITPYILNHDIILDVEQIIPVKELEEYTISLQNKDISDKQNNERLKRKRELRRSFWSELLDRINESSELFKNISPSPEYTLNCSTGIAGVKYTFVASIRYTSVECCIKLKHIEETKAIYDFLKANSTQIEQALQSGLEWDRGANKKESRILWKFKGVNFENEGEREEAIEIMVNNMIKFDEVIRPYLQQSRMS